VKLSDQFRPCYTTVAAAGKRADRIAARLALAAVEPLTAGAERLTLTLALDDTPTPSPDFSPRGSLSTDGRDRRLVAVSPIGATAGMPRISPDGRPRRRPSPARRPLAVHPLGRGPDGEPRPERSGLLMTLDG